MGSSARHTTEFGNWVLCLLPANRLLASIHLLSNSLHKKTTHYTQHPMSSDPPPRVLTEVQRQRRHGTVSWYLSSSYIMVTTDI